MKKYNKKGISLIVLVITIIVMIILAAAIILSISNSGIMSKANKAKTDSDAANLKEYVNVLEAEWELMTESERQDSGYTSKEEYVNQKLNDKGYTDAVLSADGEVYTGLKEEVREVLAGGLKIGDEVKYTVAEKTISSSAEQNGSSAQSISSITDLTWRYIGVTDNGEIQIAPDIDSENDSKISFAGVTAYNNVEAELDRICSELYSSDKATALSFDIDDVNRILEYTGPIGIYELAGGTKELFTVKLAEEILELENGRISIWPYPDVTVEQIKSEPVNYYYIQKTSKNITSSEAKTKVIFQEDAYWLASSCLALHLGGNGFGGYAYFDIRLVNDNGVSTSSVVDPYEASISTSLAAIRPIVTLKSGSTLTKNADGTWSV